MDVPKNGSYNLKKHSFFEKPFKIAIKQYDELTPMYSASHRSLKILEDFYRIIFLILFLSNIRTKLISPVLIRAAKLGLVQLSLSRTGLARIGLVSSAQART